MRLKSFVSGVIYIVIKSAIHINEDLSYESGDSQLLVTVIHIHDVSQVMINLILRRHSYYHDVANIRCSPVCELRYLFIHSFCDFLKVRLPTYSTYPHEEPVS